MCPALVGLADVEIIGMIGWTLPLQVHVASTTPASVLHELCHTSSSSRRCDVGWSTCPASAIPS
jgi:hypothetical protein